MTDHNAIENLLQALEIIKIHAPANVARWFCAGVDEYMRKRTPLDACLGLASQQGKPHVVYQYKKWIRDEALCAAHAVCDGNGTWPKAGALATEICRFAPLWPQLKSQPLSPQWSQLRKKLYQAFSTGLSVPRSQRQIYDLVKSLRR